MYHAFRLMPRGSQPQLWRLDEFVIQFVCETYDISMFGLLESLEGVPALSLNRSMYTGAQAPGF